MGNFIDLTGQRLGRLLVMSRVENGSDYGARFLCKCDCGSEKIMSSTMLRHRNVKSCGCLRSELVKDKMTKHGLRYTRIYRIWLGMKNRTSNPNYKQWKDYGGRGIGMDEMWKRDFKSFYDWSMKNGYRDDLTIDRVNVNDGYYPFNCAWTTMQEQNRNRRNNVNSPIIWAEKERKI